MENRRQQKVARLVQRALGDIFQKEGSFLFGSALVTISRVYVTPDLLIARVYVSIYNVKDTDEVFGLIEFQKKEIRKLLGNRLRHQLRRIPELEFYKDDSLDEVYRLEKLLKDLKNPDTGKPTEEDK